MLYGGMKASELIKDLERNIEKHGDQYVFSGGTDYPEGVGGVRIKKKGDGYVPTGAFQI